MGHTHRTGPIRQISDLLPGDHLCCIYDSEPEHRALVTAWLRQGLERNERVLYIAHSHNASTIIGYLQASGLTVEPYLERGQLQIITAEEAYLRSGTFDPDTMISLLRSETERSAASGYAALRATGEMTWSLHGRPGSERLIEYESKLNTFFPGSHCLALCQYDRRRFDPAVLLHVVATHPIIVVGERIYENPYFVPPEWVKDGNITAAILRQWLEGLAERQVTRTVLRESADRYRALFMQSSDPILVLGPDRMTVMDANQAALALLGFQRSDLIGGPLAPMVVDPPAGAALRQQLEPPRPLRHWEAGLRRKDGSTVRCQIHWGPVRLEGEELLGFQGTLRLGTEPAPV